MRNVMTIASRIALVSVLILPVTPAMAQSGSSISGDGEIIVTARKRDETSIAVPVVLTAVSGEELERRGLVKLDDLTKVVPQLQLGTGGGNILGGVVQIRGIAGPDNNPFADQATSFNIDGVQVSKVLVRRLAEMDLAAVEVLKGPQALFFGKNSPAGIISMRSADPTDRFQAKATGGYEFNAREWRGDGFVSGPLTDTLGARLAVFGSKMSGWFHNDVDNGDVYRTAPKRLPKTKEWAARATLKWEPSDNFNLRLKAAYGELDDHGSQTSTERMNCPLGVPQLGIGVITSPTYDGGPDTCKLDGHGFELDLGPLVGSIFPERFPKDGEPFLHMKQALISNEMNYSLSEQFTLTSVTGYYYVRQAAADMFNTAWNPSLALPSANRVLSKEFSQEVRLASSFDGWANFLAGGYFQHTNTTAGSTTFQGVAAVNGVNPSQVNNNDQTQKGTAYSFFGQLLFKPVEQIEITAGGRYSYERKQLTRVEAALVGPGPIPRLPIPLDPRFPRKESWTNFSPEFSVSYRPSQDLTVFGNYKHGFLSGGFNFALSAAPSELRFGQQKIKGFEGGVKTRLLDGALRLNLAAYRYVITGMQVTTTVFSPSGVPTIQVINAGKATTKGVEFDFNYRTPLQGLSLRGAVGFNDSFYNKFSGVCYRGQTQELGCNLGVPTTTVIGGQSYTAYNLQDLAGHDLLRAPKWSGSVGAGYEADLGSSLRFGLNADMAFSSSYDTTGSAPPHARQKSHQFLDAGARIGAKDESWEVALIGKNLTNKYVLLRSSDSTGGTTGGRAANDPRGNILGDPGGSVNRGREIMLRVTTRFGGS